MSTALDERVPAFTIGDRLRKAREKTGLDQGPFAVEIGVSRGTVSNYERAASGEGMKKPYLVAWALRCDVPVEWLLTGKAPGEGGGDGGRSGSMDTNHYPYEAAA
jgi:transcriptional regulator with XRE-family HTH domain